MAGCSTLTKPLLSSESCEEALPTIKWLLEIFDADAWIGWFCITVDIRSVGESKSIIFS